MRKRKKEVNRIIDDAFEKIGIDTSGAKCVSGKAAHFCTLTAETDFQVIFIKPGMACKAFWKYIDSGDYKNIERQIKKGVIAIIK